MSTNNVTELPDPIYGSADVSEGNRRDLRVSGGEALLHAHVGGMYLAMSERNWRMLFAALSELEVGVQPRSYRIVFDDEARTADISEVSA